MRSAPTSGERAVNASVDSSGSKLIQHWRRKYSHGTTQPPFASRKTILSSGNRSHTPPASTNAIVYIMSNGFDSACVKYTLSIGVSSSVLMGIADVPRQLMRRHL